MTTEEIYALFKKHPEVTTDSRHCPPGSLFFALQGDHFDGNKFAASAIEKGCSHAFVDSRECANGETIHYLPCALKALQQLASYHRRQWGGPLIAITGTNGKTTTKELTAAILQSRYKVLATEGNLNNHIGVALMLLRLRPEQQLAVIEMGAGKPGDIAELVTMARPTEGIITNIGKAHLQGFGSLQGVQKTKGELYAYIRATGGHLYVNANDAVLCSMSEGISRSLYGTHPPASVCATADPTAHTLAFDLDVAGTARRVTTQLVGSYNLPNALAALAVAARFQVEPEAAVAALEAYTPSNMRSQWIQTARNQLVVDTYNANPSSVEAALRDFALWNNGPKMVILGDMKELGKESETEHKRVIELLAQLQPLKVLLCGSEYSKWSPLEHRCFETTEQLAAFIQTHPPEGYTIWIKGSRSMKLEQVVKLL